MTELKVDLYGHYGISAPDGAEGRLICYLPRTPQKLSEGRTRPGVLILPGGGYAHTSPREGEPVALQWLTRGYAAFVLEYSCAPHRFPVALRESAMAMRFIRENGPAFGVNPHMVAALGFSAGGHLCGTLGTMFDSAEVADLGPAELLRPDALCLCYPVVVSWGWTHGGSFQNLCGEDEALRARLSLEKLVRPDMPPVFLWHTRDDGSVPCRNALLLAVALEEQGVDFSMHMYRHGQHGLSVANEQVYPVEEMPDISPDIPGWIDTAAGFFRELGFAIRD